MNKILVSAGMDFVITAGTAFMALLQEGPVTWRGSIAALLGATVATLKGVKTYEATHPKKQEVEANGGTTN